MSNVLPMEKVFFKLKMFFELKNFSPEVFRNRDPYSSEVEKATKVVNFACLPVTNEGNSILFASLNDPDSSVFNFDSMTKAFIMTAGERSFRNICI